MNHHPDAPKLSLLPFLVCDLALLATATLFASRSTSPLTPTEMLIITGCVTLGAALLLIPVLVNYTRRQDALLTERQNQIAALSRTTADSAEQISIAVAGIHALASANTGKPPASASPSPSDDAVIRRFTQFEATAKTHRDALTQEVRQIATQVAALSQAIATAQHAAVLVENRAHARMPLTTSAPTTEPTSSSASTQNPPAINQPSATEPTDEPAVGETPADASKPSKTGRPRKPKSPDGALDLGLTSDTTAVSQSVPCADGFTRLLATAYIGIGQKLYLRGEGPGLSWEKGVPLQFVSIGKWSWETAAASAPITAKLFKNDEIECIGLGLLTLTPGHQHEVNAGF